MTTPTPSPQKSPFPPVRRVVTGHTPLGKSIFLQDTLIPTTFPFPGSISAVHDLYRTNESPAVIDGELGEGGGWVDEIKVDPAQVSSEGSTFRTVDFAPGSVSPFHRTVTLDYGIITKGTLVVELNNSERTTLNEGDTIIMRGTIHGWRNESGEWARMYCVMLGAKMIEVGGKKLEQVFLKKE